MTDKIMVVDDDPAVLEVVAEILKGAGYTVCTATNIAEAEAILEKEKIVLAVTDIYMPDGTGLDLARKIKSVDASIPVIIITGTPKSDNVRQSVDIEVDAYLIKPVSAENLLSLVKELL
jgi:two-component system phosphate regulon response regulator PhoB